MDTSHLKRDKLRQPKYQRILLILISFLLLAATPASKRVIRVGIYENPPLEFIDEEGLPAGFVVDILQYAARQEGWDLEFVICNWDDCLAALEAGDIDLMGAIAYSKARAERFDFAAETLITNWGQVYVQSGETDVSILDLEGKMIAALEGDIHAEALQELLAKLDIDVEYIFVEDYVAVMTAVESGKTFSGVVNHLFALQHANDYQVEQSAIIFNPIEVRFAATKGRHPDLLSALDEQLAALKADKNSLYYQSLNIWFGEGRLGESLPTWMIWSSAILLAITILLSGFNWLLRSQVRKRTAELQESEAKYRELVDNSLVGVYIVQDHTIQFANQGLADLFGCPSGEDMLGLHVQNLVTSQSWERVSEEVFLRESGQRKSSHYQFQGLRADGSIVDIEALGTAIEYQGQPAVQGVLIDISERVRVEERFQALSEASFEAIFISEKGIFLEQNLAAEKMFGYTLEEVIGKTGADLFVLEDRDRVITNMLSGHEVPYRATALRKDGSAFPVEVRARMMQYKGRAVRVAGLREITEQVRAEEALAEKSIYLNNILRSATEYAIATTDLDFRITYYNPLAEEFFGYTAEEVIGKTVQEMHTGEQVAPERFEKAIENVRAHGEHRYQIVQEGDDGARHFDSRVSGILDLGGELVGFALFSRDITERVQAETALRESEERYRMLFERSSAPIYRSTFDGQMLDCNRAFIEMLGYKTLAEIQAQSAADFYFDPTDREEFIASLKEHGSLRNLESRLRDKDGNPVWILEEVSLIENQGTEPHILGTAIDITASKKVESALQESESRYRNLFGNMPIGVYRSTPEGKMLDANPAFVQMLGYPDKETLLRVNAAELFANLDDRKLELSGLENKDIVRKFEIQIRQRNGNLIWVQDTFRALRDSDGQVLYFEGSLEDITERAQAQEQLTQYMQQLEALREASLSLTSDLSLQAVLDTLLEYVLQLTGADDAHIFIYENEKLHFGAARCVDGPRGKPFAEPRQNGLTYTVARSGERVVVNDMSQAPIFQNWPLKGAIVGFPLLHGDQVIGVMNVAMDVPHEFSDSELRILELLADQAAVAINNARLYEQVQQHVEQLEILNTVTTALSTSLALDEVLKLILEQIKTVIPFDSASVFLLEKEALKIVIAEGLAAELVGQTYPLENKLMKTVAQTRQPLVLPDAQADDRFESWGNTQRIHGWMGIPLVARDDLVGFLTLDSYQADVYTPEHATIAQSLAGQAAQAIDNARLYEQVIRDSNEMEKRVRERTEELQNFVNLTAGREIRMAELKDVIKKLRAQLIEAGHVPVADDPLFNIPESDRQR